MKTAHLIKRLTSRTGAKQSVYRMDPPYYGEHEYVVLSGIWSAFGHEVMMFPSDGDNITDFGDLECVRGTTDHSELLDEIGYTMVDET
jgi:hypothetical protein